MRIRTNVSSDFGRTQLREFRNQLGDLAGKPSVFMSDKAKILLVEDEIPVAMLMVNALSRCGCAVQVAHTGRKGMEAGRDRIWNSKLLAPSGLRSPAKIDF